ncbi:alpha/beta fold hydrolase [Niallia sp. XMNu-256]|uniref:alpha/beta hydrolase n=1 Tax=Niallia sp. XMNu-256 TaxID=3082444 RepID=UPI0030CBBF67
MRENFQVIKGAEPFYFKGSEIGVLISHGFMGTPQSMRYLGENLARYGYTVSAIRLKGHGTHYRDLENCTHDDWFESLEHGYQELKKHCTNIIVIGQSMGGALTLKLAHKYRDLKGIILINPALQVPTYDSLKEAIEPRFISEGNPDIHMKNVHEITYDLAPLKSIHQLQKIMGTIPALLPSIQCPVLGIQSAKDHVVPPENTDYIIGHIGSDKKEKVILQNSYHVASMDYDKEQIVKVSHQFIQQQMNKRLMYAQ